MNRREFLKSIVVAIVGSQVPIDLSQSIPPVSLYGIPYHQSNAHIGTWLGIERSTTPWVWKPTGASGQLTRESILKMVDLLQKDKDEHNL